MREIKFRLFNKRDKKMYLFDPRWGNYYDGDGWVGAIPIEEERVKYAPSNRVQLEPESCEWMQFTGLLDKNDREIYEGDIVLIHHRHLQWHGKESTWQVVTEETAWGYAFSWEHISGYECSTHVMEDSPCNYEVIGNIYLNPELLAEKVNASK